MGRLARDAGLLIAIAKRRRALRLGVLLGRSAAFRAPYRIRLGGRRVELALPDEHAVNVAFAEILFADVYGVESARDVRTVLDVGAHAGLFTLAARVAHPGATIHAYEPNRALKPYLDANAALTDTVVYYEAIGARSGRATLQAGEETVNTRIVASTGGDVPVTAFRTAVERLHGRVDFLKIDCEGGEWDLFADCEPWAAVRYVGLEYHGDGQRAAAELESLGFTITAAETGPYGIVRAHR